ncbi:MAG: hypothetical protein MI923_25695 [Phycisphaerales bacterium]|nr:hypothetical protein [Phycisphaerales bacterium]
MTRALHKRRHPPQLKRGNLYSPAEAQTVVSQQPDFFYARNTSMHFSFQGKRVFGKAIRKPCPRRNQRNDNPNETMPLSLTDSQPPVAFCGQLAAPSQQYLHGGDSEPH